jgi:hypothetical protein
MLARDGKGGAPGTTVGWAPDAGVLKASVAWDIEPAVIEAKGMAVGLVDCNETDMGGKEGAAEAERPELAGGTAPDDAGGAGPDWAGGAAADEAGLGDEL